ncbi:MAG: NAD-dependent epimerase/dehydratase family protein [Armatimonadota bacterium]
MRVAVIGGNGFLGRAVALDLGEHGYDVCVMDLQEAPAGDFEYRQCDITDLGRVEKCLEDVEAVALTAAVPAPRPFDMWPEIMRVNVLGTYNVFCAAAARSMGKVVFASSICAQGWLGGAQRIQPLYYPIDEEHPDLPQEPYSASKKMNEISAQGFAITHDTQFVGLRYCNIQDVAQHGAKVMSTGIQWTMVEVKDAATAYRLALEAEGMEFDYFIIGSRHRYNDQGEIQDPEELRQQLEEAGVRDIRDPQHIAQSRATHSSDKAMRVLGYDPRY